MQLAGRAFEDSVVIQAADAYEKVTDWGKESPDI
jgi:Asp-tRNA(Asn)/Glu-tRNA(Gln) amidotransferase A subunit family amidase